MTLISDGPEPALLVDDGASALDRVLAEGAVRSVFQPIVDLDSGAVVAYEALARGPAGLLQSPDVLFDMARRAGRLAELDEACRRAAFRGAVTHGLLAPLTVFVNVEPEVLDDAPLDDLQAIAAAAPGALRVVLEITERALAVRPADLLRTVERVRALGWGVALDDVGADVLSLAFMPLLRPDVVKLDLRLVQDRPGPQVAEIMNAVNAYAERSGALVLAEGIETEEHLLLGRGLGARLGQGWLFGRPAPGPVAALPVGELPLSKARTPLRGDLSPFACLPASTGLRRAPKRLLVELSKQLEREAMRQGATCVVAATFQEARNFTPSTAQRYRDLGERVGFVCALGDDLPVDPVVGVRGARLDPEDPVRGEWDVVVVGPHFTAALLARDLGEGGPDLERTFEFALTYDQDTATAAASALLSRVAPRPSQPVPVPVPVPVLVAVPVAPVPAPPAAPLLAVGVLAAGAPGSAAAAAGSGGAGPEAAQVLLHQALAATSSGIAISDMTRPDQPLVYVNAAFEQLCGLRAEQVLGRNCRFLQGSDTDPGAISRMRAALDAGLECREVLLNHRGPERTAWWNEICLTPVVDGTGRVVQYIGVQNDVTDRVQAERAADRDRDRAQRYLSRLEQLADTDPLTGLATRRVIGEKVETALWDARADGGALALLVLDLDGFRAVNDRLGHDAGDELLVLVAQRLRARLRRRDVLARLGGDEFLLAALDLHPPRAQQNADRLAAQLRSAVAEPLQVAGTTVEMTVSVGVSLFPDDASEFGILRRLADQRMYRAKHPQHFPG